MFVVDTYIVTHYTLVQRSDVEVESLVNYSALFGVLRIKRVVLAILVDKVAEDGAAERFRILNYAPKIMK
jgi:hypothetical protein